MNRRTFISSLGAPGASYALTPRSFAADVPPPMVGLIGCGWYGLEGEALVAA
jgi:hypothetical protein